MANNNNIFNAALGGASAGVASRWLTNTSSASYANQAALILAFATAFDDAIPVDPSGGSRGQCSVVSDICSAFCKDRVLTSSLDMDLAVAPLVALYNELATSIEPDAGGGGGGTLAPLTNTFWVDQLAGDPTEAGTAVSNGTEGALASLTESLGVAAAAVPVVLFVLAGDYSAEAALDFTAIGIPKVDIYCYGAVSLPEIICDIINVVDATIVGNLTATSGRLLQCTFAGASAVAGAFVLDVVSQRSARDVGAAFTPQPSVAGQSMTATLPYTVGVAAVLTPGDTTSTVGDQVSAAFANSISTMFSEVAFQVREATDVYILAQILIEYQIDGGAWVTAAKAQFKGVVPANAVAFPVIIERFVTLTAVPAYTASLLYRITLTNDVSSEGDIQLYGDTFVNGAQTNFVGNAFTPF